MRCDRDDRDLAPFRAVAPEESIRPRRLVLDIGLPHFFTLVERVFDGCELVCLKPGVTWIARQEAQAFDYLFEKTLLPRSLFFLGSFVG